MMLAGVAMAAAAASAPLPVALPAPLLDPANPFSCLLRADGGRAVIAASAEALIALPPAATAPGQALVIPRQAVARIEDLPEPVRMALYRAAEATGRAQQAAFGATGFTVVAAVAGTGPGRSFPAHLHIVPRYDGAGPADAQSHAGAARLKASLGW